MALIQKGFYMEKLPEKKLFERSKELYLLHYGSLYLLNMEER